jgi:hypothetical protein
MPRLLLEEHLRVLHEELVAAVPERALEYASLLAAANGLRVEREAFVPASVLRTFETGFHDLLQRPTEDDLGADVLIAAAVADERAGVPRAVASLLEWLADPAVPRSVAGGRRRDASPRQAERAGPARGAPTARACSARVRGCWPARGLHTPREA